MRTYYTLLDKIKTQLLADNFVETCTSGDIYKVDIDKQSLYPLSHVIIGTGSYQERVWQFSVSVICMDLVDNQNEDDVLNTQLAVVNRLIEVMYRGDLHDEKYQVVGNPSVEPFTDRFENDVAGWTCTFDVQVINDMTIC